MVNRLNLLWRLIGGNIILIIIGIILHENSGQNTQYLVTINAIIAIIVAIQVVTRKLSILSDIKEILKTYVICTIIVNLFNIETTYESLISTFSAIVSGMWIIKFIMIKKAEEIE